jgi:NADH-quinone oxidoreductase subunit H
MCRISLPACFLLLVVGAASLMACQRETTPPLIQVDGVAPHELETGDRVRITGVGFPEGKTAHVTFRGDLFRPATVPVRGVDIDVDGIVVSGTEIELPMSEALERRFAGSGDRAAHTTFKGEVTVAFAAGAPAAPPVTGALLGAWLDVRPPTPHGAALGDALAEGERTLEFLGITPDPVPVAAGGVLVAKVRPGSRAEGARLLPSDIITELDGVRVLSLRDLAAVPGERVAWLKIRRGGSPHEEVAEVSLTGLAPPPAAALLGPVLVLGFATIVLLMFFAPSPSILAWTERHISVRLRAPNRGALVPRGPLSTILPVAALVSSTYALFPLSHLLGIGDIDVGVVVVLAAASLVMLAIAGGTGSSSAPSVRARLAAAARVLCLQVPLAAGTAAVVAMTGSFRLEDIVRAQGGSPWRWTLFASPTALAWFVLWLLTDLADWTPGPGLPEAMEPRARAPRAKEGAARVFSLAVRISRFTMCGVAAALFLGGWQIPGFASEQTEGHLGWAMLGVLVFVSKAWFLVLLTSTARATLPVVRAETVLSLSLRWTVPLSLVLLLLTATWVLWGPGPSAESLVGAVMTALSLALTAHIFMRARHFGRDLARAPGLDAFL